MTVVPLVLVIVTAAGSRELPGAASSWKPSTETSQVFYGAESTTATLTCAGNFAQAAPIFRSVGLTNYASTLSNAAVAAYNWAVANPSVLFTNTGFASGSPEVDTSTTTKYNFARDSLRIRAAVYLYELASQSAYRTYVESSYTMLLALSSGWWGPYETPVQDALLHYATLPGVTASVATNIRFSSPTAATNPCSLRM